jgi:Bacterial SCP ortholog
VKKDPQIAVEVKEIFDLIKKIAPGKSVELRIPPYGAIQCVKGINHKRGTPPNIVEMSAQILIQLRSNPKMWAELMASGQISASGVASDLSLVFSQLLKPYPVVES